jgi:CHASE2 domain-containing sensor protein
MNEQALVVLIGAAAAAGIVLLGRLVRRHASKAKQAAWRTGEIGLLLACAGFILSGALGWTGFGGSLALIGTVFGVVSISRINRPE